MKTQVTKQEAKVLLSFFQVEKAKWTPEYEPAACQAATNGIAKWSSVLQEIEVDETIEKFAAKAAVEPEDAFIRTNQPLSKFEAYFPDVAGPEPK